ncbi:MAG: hypothetical protein K2O32_00025 [Acetatifactor sp.]|nr:hypothetical protein [Acetatifactor sp.]
MQGENEDIKIVKIVTITVVSMFLGIVLIILTFILLPKLLGGSGRIQYMKEREIKLAQKELQEKYGEEFIIRDVYSRSPATLCVHCSPASNEEIVFRAEIFRDGRGVEFDEYIEGIVARKIEKEIEDELKKYYNSVFVQVYLTSEMVQHSGEPDREVDGIKDITPEEYVKRFDPLMCRVDIGIDAKEGNEHLEEEYAFYESMREKISNQEMVPLYVVYCHMDAELQEWCNNYFTQYSEAPGIYTGKRAECNKMEFDCSAEGIGITYDEFQTMREGLGENE